MKAVKESYEKIGQDILYFDFIAGFNHHSVYEEIIPESKWNECLPEKVLSFLVLYVKIWCFK